MLYALRFEHDSFRVHKVLNALELAGVKSRWARGSITLWAQGKRVPYSHEIKAQPDFWKYKSSKGAKGAALTIIT